MSVKEMKAAISAAGMSHVGVTEKEDLRHLAALALEQVSAASAASGGAMEKFLGDIRAGDVRTIKAAISTDLEMHSFSKDELLAGGLVEACLSHVADPAVATRPPRNADLRLLSQGGGAPMPICAINVLLNATSNVRKGRWDAAAVALQLRPLLQLMALDVRTVWGEPRIWDGVAVMALGLIRNVILHGQAAAKDALWSGTGCGDACLRLAACALEDERLQQAGLALGMRGVSSPRECGATVIMEWCDVGLSGSASSPDASGRATLALVAAVPCGPRQASSFAAELPRLVGCAAAAREHGVLDSLEYSHAGLIKEGGEATGALREGAAVRQLVSAAEGRSAARDAVVAKHLCGLLAASLGGAAGTPTDAEGEAVIGAGGVEAALRLCAAHPLAAELQEDVVCILRLAQQAALQKRTGAALRQRAESMHAAVGALRAKGASSHLIEIAAAVVGMCRTVSEATAAGNRPGTQVLMGVDKFYCSWCHVEKPQEQLKRCGKCKFARYCSPGCQHADWPTHKKECKLKAKALESGHATTGSAARRRDRNDSFDADAFSRAANALFWRRATEVVQSAALQRVDLFDCVVCIDMCGDRHRVRPVPLGALAAFLDEAIGVDYTDGEHTEVVHERNRRNGALTALAYAPTGRPPPEETHQMILKTFPPNPGLSWRQMHDQLLGMPAFQEQLASSDSHEEAIDALALGLESSQRGEGSQRGARAATAASEAGRGAARAAGEGWASIPGMTPEAAALAMQSGMTPDRFRAISQMMGM